jgi:ribose transport system permease protein
MVQSTEVSEKSLIRSRLWYYTKEYFLILIVVIMYIVFGIINSNFLSSNNIQNMLRQAAANSIISLGMLAVVLTGGIDLSVGMMAGFAGVLIAGLLREGIVLPLAFPAVILIGLLIGLFNGFIIVYMGLAPFIATMATMTIVTGAKLLYSHSLSIFIKHDAFSMLGNGNFIGIPVPIVLMILLTFLFQFVMSKTTYGRNLYALGGNPDAARLAGINNNVMILSVYVVSGFCSFFAGIILASRLAVGSPLVGTGFETNAIASVVIGGGSLAGGRGKPVLTLFGAMVIAMLSNFLNLMGVQNYIQRVITGAIIIIAVFLSEHTNRKRRV